jgi:hypothetical protein
MNAEPRKQSGRSLPTRRHALTALGAGAVAAAVIVPGADAAAVQAEREYQGESAGGNLQEALDSALAKLDADLGAGGVSDAMGNWRLAGVTGQRGGIAGVHSVKVTLVATRTPPFPKKSQP